MTTIHTFHTAQGTKVTRKSQTREYAACLVATVTDEVVKQLRADVRACEKAVPEAEAKLAGLLVEQDTTVEAATARHEDENSNAGGTGKSWHSLQFDEVRAINAETPNGYNPNCHNLAPERLKARGIVDPYRKDGPFAVVNAAMNVREAKRRLETARKKLAETNVGDQEVLSWHLTLSNAQKALDAQGGKKAYSRTPLPVVYREKGYRVSYETTFEVRETKPRKAKKA